MSRASLAVISDADMIFMVAQGISSVGRKIWDEFWACSGITPISGLVIAEMQGSIKSSLLGNK